MTLCGTDGILQRMNPSPYRVLRRYAVCVLSAWLLLICLLTIIHFPRAVDPPAPARAVPSVSSEARAQDFYRQAYQPDAAGSSQPADDQDNAYVKTARRAAQAFDVKGSVTRFVNQYGLSRARVLEVGAGSGLLQDIVDNYTALDISANARRFFHKPFVQASATAMPFRDGEFDSVWSIWVLEHVPHPEWALSEIRRVVKDNGLLYLAPAWDCTAWAGDGYEVRPYGDFGFWGKVVKASVPVRKSGLFKMASTIPVRVIRHSFWQVTNKPAALRYQELTPNFDHYWVPDSDAVNSIDSYEAYLWFVSRGDRCLNCEGAGRELLRRERWPMIIQVRKPVKSASQ